VDVIAVAEADEDFTDRTISLRASMMPRPQADASAHLLLVHVENAPPRHVPLNLLPLIVGRNSPADVILDGTTVSRRHCMATALC
jgi:FHA domain